MNWVILAAIALYFIATAVNDGATGWHFDDSGSFNVRVSNDDYSLRVRSEGDVELPADGSGVTALSTGDSLDIRLTRNGVERRVLFSSESGAIKQQFFVEGDEQPWGPEADRFVAEVMPIVLRETAINADERVAWLIANRGHAGLLDEIELIQSDFAQRVYTVQYAETATIADTDFARLMKAAGDHMGSDFDLRTTLSAVYDAQTPTGESFTALLADGGTLGSDFDARTLLEHVGPRMPNAAEAATAYLELATTIGSDFDMRLALQPLVTQPALADEVVAEAIDMAATELGSDFDLRTLLSEAAPRVGRSDVLARAYTRATRGLGSDFDHREALTALADGADLSPAGWRLLLDSTQGIGSDFDAAALLMNVAPKLPRDEEVLAAYRAALATIDSDFDRQRAADALETASR